MSPHDHWEQLFHRAPTGYLTTTDDGVVVLVNETFLRWSGYRREQVVGTRLTSLMPVGDQVLYAANCMPRLAMNGAVEEVALEIVGSDGQRHAALLSAVRTPATASAPATVAVVVFGAQQRRRFEHDLLASRRRAEESEARLAEATTELQRRVHSDPLTGLLNRDGLTTTLRSSPGAPGPGRALALLLLDLDNFKAVNDSLGHAAGDDLLVVVAQRLRAEARTVSTVARLSGDEFVVVEPVGDPAAAGALAQRLIDAVTRPVVVGGLELLPSVSIGIALAQAPEDGDSLLHRADLALHRAKASGRGGWLVHDRTEPDPTAGRLQLLGELRRGISSGELRVHYQPRVALRTGTVDGVEALVRWQHPGRGLLPPAEFIALAESSGLVRSLGVRVLEIALAQAVDWQRSRYRHLGSTVAVNLSTRQLGDPDLLATVAAALARHELTPGTLTLEITETALMEDPDAARVTLAALKELGVGLAIDDFGTGYSSMSYLKRFPVDELKVDRSFIAGVAHDGGDRAIVAACIQLAHAVGGRAVAEGVETEEQRSTLLELGCDLVQGYLCSPPRTAAELEAWFDDGRREPARSG